VSLQAPALSLCHPIVTCEFTRIGPPDERKPRQILSAAVSSCRMVLGLSVRGYLTKTLTMDDVDPANVAFASNTALNRYVPRISLGVYGYSHSAWPPDE
jgi:hypothetical protein